MTSKNGSRPKMAPKPASGQMNGMPARMVNAGETSWSGADVLGRSKSADLSRQRMLDARADFLRSEREFMSVSLETEASMRREAEALERKAAEIRAEGWAIEQEMRTQVTVMQAQAQMENQLAKHIRDIAERSALSVLDRIKEASDSLMDWAGLIGNDLSDMLRKEAAEQTERKVAEIQAIEEAMDEEDRATELLELTSRYKTDLAA